jgi:hypothetical protein
MTHVAAIPSWMIFIFVMAFIGPAVRYLFGSRSFMSGGRWDRAARLGRADIERLEAALSDRDTVIEDLQHRISEMESRLDFTERLIAQKAEADRPAVR